MRGLASFRIPVFAAAATILLACSDGERPAAPSALTELEATSSEQTTFSGRATVVDATVLGTNAKLADTGPLPPEGGARDATVLEAEVPGLLRARVLHATTVGQGNASRSEASVADLHLTVEGHTIEASFLMARASATCEEGEVVLEGDSFVANLFVDGAEVEVTGEPNQTIDLSPAGQVIINEQSRTDDAITVNALHVVIPGAADVVVSHAHADIGGCPGDCPEIGDFVTGGGWITVEGRNRKANFGVGGGVKNGELWGHLTYIDHGQRLRVKATAITSYEATGETSRRIEGTAEIDGEPGTFVVEVADEGEPGRADTFEIQLSTGYTASGALGGGNIQLHDPEPCP